MEDNLKVLHNFRDTREQREYELEEQRNEVFRL
jgi:hypothetical protein